MARGGRSWAWRRARMRPPSTAPCSSRSRSASPTSTSDSRRCSAPPPTSSSRAGPCAIRRSWARCSPMRSAGTSPSRRPSRRRAAELRSSPSGGPAPRRSRHSRPGPSPATPPDRSSTCSPGRAGPASTTPSSTTSRKGGPSERPRCDRGGSQSRTAPTTVRPSSGYDGQPQVRPARRRYAVLIRKTVAALAIVAVVVAACGGGGSSAAPASQAPASQAPASQAAAACKVGVAWATFQEERYGLRDEPGIKAALAAGGAEYVSGGDGQNKAEVQASQIATLIAAKVNVLVINSVDPVAVLPSVQAAIDAGIPVIAYDRELENAKALFLTHDNVLVGHMIADAVTKAQPTGNYAIIKGDKTQTNPIFLRNGMEEVLKPLVDSGAIKIVGEEFTDGWTAENAQKEMEQILTKNNNNIQGILSENDNMATGAVAALTAQGLAGKVKIGGQDGDTFALNRVALGTQVVSVWKNATELGDAAGKAAIELCKNPDISKVTGAAATKTSGGLDAFSLLLKPIPITKDNLQVVLDAKWITVDKLCKDVPAGSVKGCP